MSLLNTDCTGIHDKVSESGNILVKAALRFFNQPSSEDKPLDSCYSTERIAMMGQISISYTNDIFSNHSFLHYLIVTLFPSNNFSN